MSIEEKIALFLIKNKLTLSTTESCTGGLLSSKLTDISGSSAFINLNLITYSNKMKQKMLSVRKETLENFGAVSEECAFEMAKGLFNLTESDICVSTTGIAGPTGGSKEKPVGLMYSTIYTKNKSLTFQINLPQNTPRIQMKEMFVEKVLLKLHEFLINNN